MNCKIEVAEVTRMRLLPFKIIIKYDQSCAYDERKGKIVTEVKIRKLSYHLNTSVEHKLSKMNWV